MVIFICNSSLTFTSAQKPKILCLHGGTGNQDSIAAGVADIANALPEYEFVYANGAYGISQNSYVWIPDPPGGKGEPTTDPGWADESIQVLDDILEAQGPFHGILGYSQGAAFVPVYLSRVPNDTFQFAITFCGYLTTTHLGLLGTVQDRSPFGDIPHLVWMGQYDFIISNPMTREMAADFTNPTIVESNVAGHIVPGSNDPTFGQVVSWIRDGADPVRQQCVDSSLRFKVVKNERTITRNCIWIGRGTVQRCALPGASAACPVTCDTCNTCEDTTVRFRVEWNERRRFRDCAWISKRATVQKCNLPGVSDSCPETCGVCG